MSISIHQIFQENSNVTSVKDVKQNSKSKTTGLSLKTSNAYDERPKSDSSYEIKKPSNFTLGNKTKENEKVEIKLQKSRNSSSENWPEIETMHNYGEPEDDYEDVIPKRDRFTNADIENFFKMDYFTQALPSFDKWEAPHVDFIEVKALDFEPMSFCYLPLLEDPLEAPPEPPLPLPGDADSDC